MSVKQIIYRHQAEAIDEIVDAWKGPSDDASWVREVEEVVAEGIRIAGDMTGWVQQSFQELQAGRLRLVLTVGNALREAVGAFLTTLRRVRQFITRAQAKGYTVERVGEFEGVITSLEVAERRLATKWPFPDHAQIQESLAAYARGEGEDLGDWIHELQGPNQAGN